MTQRPIWVTATIALTLVSSACSHHTASLPQSANVRGEAIDDPLVTARPAQHEGAEATNRTVFLVATRQKPRILESLGAAGIAVAPDLLDAGFMLRVTIGVDQGSQACGTRNNVKYALRRENAAVVELADKGWTGTCTPNVLDALSQRLAETLASGNRSESTPDH